MLLTFFGVLLQALFQVLPQFSQALLVTGLLGKSVIERRQLPRLQVIQGDVKARRAAAAFLLGVALGELAVHGFALPGCHPGNPFHKAGDHPPLLQFHLQTIGAAASNGLIGVGEHAAEAHHSHIAHGRGAITDWHQGSQLTPGLLDQLIDAIGVIVNPDSLGFQPFDAIQRRRGRHVHLKRELEFLGWVELLKQVFKAAAHLGLPQHLQLFLCHGIAQHGIHQLLQGGGFDAHDPDLLDQHLFGDMSGAKARQAHRAAQLADRGVVGGLAAFSRHPHLQGQAAAGTRGGFDLEAAAHRCRAEYQALNPRNLPEPCITWLRRRIVCQEEESSAPRHHQEHGVPSIAW